MGNEVERLQLLEVHGRRNRQEDQQSPRSLPKQDGPSLISGVVSGVASSSSSCTWPWTTANSQELSALAILVQGHMTGRAPKPSGTSEFTKLCG